MGHPQHEATTLRRFWQRVDKTEGCWIWTGSRTIRGYGHTMRRGRYIYSHRVSYEIANGPIPPGFEIDHLCRNPSCVRPDHLEPVTHAENMRRADSYWLARTHCSRGHEYTPENTRTYRRRERVCRICARARNREYEARRRA